MKLILKYDEQIKTKLLKKFGENIRLTNLKKYYFEGNEINGENRYRLRDEGYKEDFDTKSFMIISFKNQDVLDRNEIETYNYIKKNYKILEIQVFSKKFIDLHEVTETKEFQKAIKELEPKIKPMYVNKSSNYWWIGFKDINGDFDVEKQVKEIYRVGLGLSLIPCDFVGESERITADEES